ncbi:MULTISPECIES: hypothetical protein [unclassified Cobetia]|uniref:hypothetical protein n=1 Tax=unclassified Cobetia TaxID=2609414 RepID=UPI00178CA90A|nr:MULTISPECIES: hypothetical protein [unclassified Cobetia]MBE2167431.1 hypothetical protein [Cobetia sp. 2AS1]MDH2447124.1 hypothetical protein [Cobetia sp. 2AS]
MNKTPPPWDEVPLYVRYFQGLPICEERKDALSALQKVWQGEELVAWVNAWACDEDWRRARDSIRAYRYKSRHHLTRANIDQATKSILEQRARALGLPLWQYVQNLGLNEETLEQLEQRANCERKDKSPQA